MREDTTTLFTVGPVEMDPAIFEPLGYKLPYFRTEEFSQMMLRSCDLIKEFARTKEDSAAIFLTASGTGAMEAAIGNVFSSKDKVLIINGGTFGERFEMICQTLQIPYSSILLPPGKALVREDLEPFRDRGYTGLLINAHETSTGVYYNLPTIGEFCKEEGLLFIVDAISSFMADPFYMDEWNIDIAIISSQKALAVSPGISILIVNKQTTDRICKQQVCSLYFNLKQYLEDSKRGQTPFTPAVGVLLQLSKRLEQIKKVGLETVIQHTQSLAEDFREKIKDLPLVIESESLSNALTPLSSANGKDAYEIFQHLKNRYHLIVNPNGGLLKNRLFRVGHIGKLSFSDNQRLIDALHNMKKEGLL